MSTGPAGPPNGATSGPPTTVPPAASSILPSAFVPLVSVVDFHHARGPEVERWFGASEGLDPAVEYDWGLLPFMALSDGAHASTEDFSYFTLLRPASPDKGQCATSLFGMSCTRQLDASQLLVRPADVTRSTVQKAVVVISDSPHHFGTLRERLSVVTKAWFAQREFGDVEILRRFQESLAEERARGTLPGDKTEQDSYLGMSLREMVREFKWQTLVLLKCCLLQPKMLFFGTRCERLCMTQFSLISLIPGLLRNLRDCAGPELNDYEATLHKPTSVRTTDRPSLHAYVGLPLQIFGKGSLFGPYTPLQQLDILADFGTKSYIVGSTNPLLLQQRDRYSDILINLDEGTINITSSSLRIALALTAADRRWIDYITQTVNETWDEADPSRPKTMGYVGSEEFIRMQFEEYLLSLIASVKYHNCLVRNAHNPRAAAMTPLPHIEGDPSLDFGPDWVEAWSHTENYRIWEAHTDSHLFDVVEPKHACAGGLTVEDVQRRIAQQVQDLHLDEKFAQGREAVGRNLQAGRERASALFVKLYSDMEAKREMQRRKAEAGEHSHHHAHHLLYTHGRGASGGSLDGLGGGGHDDSDSMAGPPTTPVTPVDMSKAQLSARSVGTRAGALMTSWAAWAGEKRKAGGWGGGWGAKSGGGANGKPPPSTPTSATPSGLDSPRASISSARARGSADMASNAGKGGRAAAASEYVVERESCRAASSSPQSTLSNHGGRVRGDDDDDNDDDDDAISESVARTGDDLGHSKGHVGKDEGDAGKEDKSEDEDEDEDKDPAYHAPLAAEAAEAMSAWDR